MKTPRELLLVHHRAATPKLDSVRREVLNGLQESAPRNPWSLRDFLWSLRWHLAGMTAIWAIILLLNMSAAQGARLIATAQPMKTPSPQVILASLRENRREIAAMIENPTPDADRQMKFLPKPRSEGRSEMMMA